MIGKLTSLGTQFSVEMLAGREMCGLISFGVRVVRSVSGSLSMCGPGSLGGGDVAEAGPPLCSNCSTLARVEIHNFLRCLCRGCTHKLWATLFQRGQGPESVGNVCELKCMTLCIASAVSAPTNSGPSLLRVASAQRMVARLRDSKELTIVISSEVRRCIKSTWGTLFLHFAMRWKAVATFTTLKPSRCSRTIFRSEGMV